MSKKAVFYPQGVCSRQYEITLSDEFFSICKMLL